MIAFALLVSVQFTDIQWAMVLACPKVSAPGSGDGTGVVIGVKDRFAYLLTAAHVAKSDKLEVQFTSRANYPKPAWFGDGAEVLARWPDPDVALIRFPLKNDTPNVLPLAPAWQRPKTFPVMVQTLGIGKGLASTAEIDTIQAREYVKREDKGGAYFWRTESAPELGRSGGPMLDSRGRVIGITVAARGGAGFYAHHDEILAALKRDGFSWLIPLR